MSLVWVLICLVAEIGHSNAEKMDWNIMIERSTVQKEVSKFIRHVLQYASQSLDDFYCGGYHGLGVGDRHRCDGIGVEN